MRKWTLIQRHMLAIMEEAAEEDLSVLINTLGGHTGLPDELDDVGAALMSLLKSDLVEIARSRDPSSLHWIPVPTTGALALLADIRSYFLWSSVDHLWKWSSKESRAQVLLTNKGQRAAHQVLSEDGWFPGNR